MLGLASALLCSLCSGLLAPSAAQASSRHASMILDANSGKVLHAQAADELRHPASLTKMMTLYMAFELIEMGRLSYTTPIKVTAEAAAAAPSKLELEPGETIQLIDAIKALVTKSANDMAIAIAQHIGGSEQNFARLMTEKARQLGMSKTVFRNASGLPNDEQVTTARDMITLGLHLQDDFPRHYPLFGLRTFAYNGGSYRNHNTLLLSYRGTDGIKTGYTHKSGFNLVANVRRDGRHVIGAIFGGESAGARNAHLRTLFDRAMPHAATERTRKAPPAPIMIVAKRASPKPTQLARAEATPSQSAPPPAPAPKPAARPTVAAAATPPPAAPAPAKAAPSLAATASSASAPSPVVTAAAKAAARAAPTKPAEAETPPPAPPAATAVEPAEAAKPATATADAGSAIAAEPTAGDAPAPAATVEGGASDIAEAGSPAGSPAIAVAKVRRVMVAPHVTRPAVAVADAGSTGAPPATPAQRAVTAQAADAAPAAAAPGLEPRPQGFAVASLGKPSSRLPPERQAAPLASAPVGPRETVLAKSAATAGPDSEPPRLPSSFEAQVAALAANVAPRALSDARPAPAAGDAPRSATAPLGAPPSTLAAQAEAIEALARGEPPRGAEPPVATGPASGQQVAAAAELPPPTYRLKGPVMDGGPRAPAPANAPGTPAPPARVAVAPAVSAPPAMALPAAAAARTPAGPGGFQIQIGAYASEAEAERRLATVQSGATALLKGHAPTTLPVVKSNRTLYRARFASFDSTSAAAACLELRRQQVDCFVMKAE